MHTLIVTVVVCGGEDEMLLAEREIQVKGLIPYLRTMASTGFPEAVADMAADCLDKVDTPEVDGARIGSGVK